MSEQVTSGVYRHYKGKFYRVLDVAAYAGGFFHGESPDGLTSGIRYGLPENEKLVVYIALYDNPHGNRFCVRTLREWLEQVETLEPCGACEHERSGCQTHDAEDAPPRRKITVPRFTRVGD